MLRFFRQILLKPSINRITRLGYDAEHRNQNRKYHYTRSNALRWSEIGRADA